MTGPVRKCASVGLLLCAATACSRAAPPPGAGTVLLPRICTSVRHAAAGQDRIIAVGRTAPGQPFGTIATVTWRTPGLNAAVVRVSEDDGPPRMMSGAASGGTAQINWIALGHTYVFGLYPTLTSRTVLASVAVKQC